MRVLENDEEPSGRSRPAGATKFEETAAGRLPQ
jgi:hypothetical protein